MEASLPSWLLNTWRFTRGMKEPEVSSETVNNINASKILHTDIIVSTFFNPPGYSVSRATIS